MFIAMNRFLIAEGFEKTFEERWRNRESFLEQSAGFIRFRLLRSRLPQLQGTTEFVSYSEWIDRLSFEAWMTGSGSKQAHSKSGPMPAGMMKGPPEFRGYESVLDQGYGHRTDYRSPFMDQHVEQLFSQESPEQKALAVGNKEAGLPSINIGAFEGRLIEILIRSIGAKKGIEVGTLGGYSTTWLARGLAPGGHITTLELDPKRADLARENFRKMGLGETVDIKVGKALDTLKELEHEGEFDFIFIDADKSNYGKYVEWAVPRIRKGGLILCDNSYIWGGMHYFGKASAEVNFTDTTFSKNEFDGMSSCWAQLRSHPELASIVMPTGEGLAVAVKI